MRGGAGLTPARVACVAWVISAGCLKPAPPDPVCACGADRPLTLAAAPDGERATESPPLRGTLSGTCAGAGIVALAYAHGEPVSATRTDADGTWALAWPRNPARPLLLIWGCDTDADGVVGTTPSETTDHVDLGMARAWTPIALRHRSARFRDTR
jgi:hypothetical protein